MAFKFHTKPFPHQFEEFERTKDVSAWAHLFEQGCVDCETEYLTPSGWKRIDRYRGGPVAQFCPKTKRATFVEPLDYVKLPCKNMLHFYNQGIDQILSTEHRVLYYKEKNSTEIVEARAYDIFDGDKQSIRMTRSFRSDMIGDGCGLTEEQLRLKVILTLQGLRMGVNNIEIRLKKSWPADRERRLLRLLKLTNTHADFRTSERRSRKYFIKAAVEDFDKSWWTKINNKERDIIVDEAFRWTCVDKNSCYNKHECNVDFIQYLACSVGVFSYLKRKQEAGWMIERCGRRNAIIDSHRDIYPVKSPDGFKYCFEVPSKCLVFRRSGKIFVSGNTGKSKLNIDNFQYLFEKGEVDSLFIVAPNGVHRNWLTDELPAHLPPELLENASCHFYQSKRAGTKWHKADCREVLTNKGLSILAMSYQGFMTKAGKKMAWDFLTKRKCYYVLDEGQYIKSPGAKRTISIMASGKYAPYRRLLSGTLGAEGPFDLYAPIKFLDPGFWRRHHLGSFASFKSFFGVWRTRQEVIDECGYDPGYNQLLEYKNLDKLRQMISTISSRVTKESAGLGLPPKLYNKLYFDMNPEQQSAYNELREEYMTIVEDEMIEAPLAIVRLMRLQQITCGYAQVDSDEPIRLIGKTNPRLDASVAHLENTTDQVLIWARFKHDISQLCGALGKNITRYDGSLSPEQAAINLEAFKRGDIQHMAINQQKGATGLTVVNSRQSMYYSNYFSLELRLQSEDRNHRIGQHNSVLYTDVIAPNTIDGYIADALRNKYDVAAQIRGDKLKEWM